MNWIKKYLFFGWIQERKQRNIERAKEVREEARNMGNMMRGRGNSSSPLGAPQGGLPPHIKEFFDMLGKGGGPMGPMDMGSPLDTFEQDLSELGEPDEIETFTDGDITWEKHTWHTPTGSIGKVEIKADFDGELPPDILSRIMSGGSRKKKKSLEEQLAIAIEEEDYEKAADIRDQIEKRDSEKVETKEKPDSETPSNGSDNWDF